MKHKILNLTNLLILLTILAAWFITSTIISPFLHYQFQQIAFVTGLDYFMNFTRYPGGIADYCSEFISQFFYFNWLGSILIVAVASIQGLIIIRITKKLVAENKMQFAIFATILISGICGFLNYHYPFYILVRLLIAFIFIWLFLTLYLRFPKQGLLYWLILACILFYAASGPALMIFAISTALILLILKKQRYGYLLIPIMLLFSAVLPYFGFKFIFLTSLENVYNISTNISENENPAISGVS